MSSTTEELGLRVTLSGNQQAAAGLGQVADAEKKVGDAAKQASTALDGAAKSTEKLTSVSQNGAQSQRTFADALQQSQASMQAQASGAGLLSGWMSKLVTSATAVTLAMSAMSAASWFGQMQDDARVTLARITNITGSLTEARAVYRGLYEDSVRLRVSQADTLQGYTRIAAAVQELGGTAEQARKINEAVIATAKISGVSSQEAAAAARQFAQALGSGVLQGDELRSILENNQEFARQLARGLNVSVGELRKLGEEGKLTASVVANAILSRLPEIEAKLASVPLTSADAWEKLKTVLTNWVVAGDQVEMKAGLIARSMNAIADGIERSRKAAAEPIVVTVRQVNQTEGGAGFIGPNLGRRNPAQIVAEQEAAAAAALAARGTAMAALRARENEFIQQSRLGLEAAGKAAIAELEKYGDSVALGSDKLQKAFDKEKKALAAAKAQLEGALASGDPRTAELARAQLAKLGDMEAKAFADAERKIAEARKSEANKAGAEAKAANAARYQESIAAEEAYQAQLREALGSETAALKRHYDAGEMSAEQYYSALHAARMTNLVQMEESVRRELETAQQAYAAGHANRKADIAKYQGELKKLEAQRVTITAETEDAITAYTRKALKERERLIAEANQSVLAYINQSRDLVRQMEAENEERQFELSLIGQTEQAQARMQAMRQAELATRRALTQAYREYIAAMDKSISAEQDAAITDAYNRQVAGIKAAGAAQGELAVQVLATKDAYGTLNSTVDSFIDAAMKGFGSLKDWLKNQFFEWIKTQVLKPLIMQIVVSATGGVSGGVGGAVGNSLLGSLFNGAGTAGGLLGGGGGLLGLGSLSGLMGLGSGAGLLGALGAGANLAITGLLGGGLSGLAGGVGLAAQGGLAPLLGALAPIGLALGAIALIAKHFDGANGTAVRYAWGDNYGSNSRPQARNTLATPFGRLGLDGDAADQTRPFVQGLIAIEQQFANRMTAAQIAAATSRIGSGTSNWIGFDGDPSKAINQEMIDMMRQRFGAVFEALDFKVLQDKLATFKGTGEEMAKWLASVAGMMQVLEEQSAYVKSVIGESVNVDQLAALAKDGETLDATFTRVVTTFTATNGIAAMLGKNVSDAFGAIGLASLDARQNLVDLAGGISQLDQMSSYFYEHFYSEAERGERTRAAALAQVNSTFASLNLTVPTSREAFRALVEGIDLSTDAGRKLFVALMQIAPAFDALAAEASDLLTVTRAAPRTMGPGAVDSSANDAWSAYLTAMYSETERATMRQRELWGQLNAQFAALGVTVPRSVAEYRRLVDSIDRTTPAGEALWQVLVKLGPTFAEATALVQQAVQALAADVLGAIRNGGDEANAELAKYAAAIDAAGGDLATRMAQKLAAAGQLLAQYQQQYADHLRETGGQVDEVAVALEAARAALESQVAGLSGDLATLTTLVAQYGADRAEKLLQLEQWKRQQVSAAAGNASLLLTIEQSYQAQRNAIINGGVASGLASLSSTVQQWLNNLLLNGQLTTLSPQAQLDEARRQMLAAYTARDGSRFTQSADAYLRLERDAHASSDAYQQIMAWVQRMAQALIGGTATPIPGPGTSGGTGSGSGSGGGGLTSGGSSNGLLTAQAQLLAEVKEAILKDGAATRENATANADRLVKATEPSVGDQRVAV